MTIELGPPTDDVQEAEPGAEPEAPQSKRRVLTLTLAGAGSVMGAIYFAVSLLPSLLPRAPQVTPGTQFSPQGITGRYPPLGYHRGQPRACAAAVFSEEGGGRIGRSHARLGKARLSML